ncbi:hypothetical protein AMK33_23840 [Streptomyces sp. CB02400]|nr:hypothetical protein AMK33_23840 [Streptomyces sp. CB02400]
MGVDCEAVATEASEHRVTAEGVVGQVVDGSCSARRTAERDLVRARSIQNLAVSRTEATAMASVSTTPVRDSTSSRWNSAASATSPFQDWCGGPVTCRRWRSVSESVVVDSGRHDLAAASGPEKSRFISRLKSEAMATPPPGRPTGTPRTARRADTHRHQATPAAVNRSRIRGLTLADVALL